MINEKVGRLEKKKQKKRNHKDPVESLIIFSSAKVWTFNLPPPLDSIEFFKGCQVKKSQTFAEENAKISSLSQL